MSNDTRTLHSHTRRGDGAPTLTSIVALDGYNDAAILALAASLARSLDTPAAAAIVEGGRAREIEIQPVAHVHRASANGVAAVVGDQTVVLGDAAFLNELGLAVEYVSSWRERLRQRGEQVLCIAVDGRTAGFLSVADPTCDRQRQTDVMEEDMRTVANGDQFPTAAATVSASQPAESINLADGERFELRIAPVTKRLGDSTVRMLAYNGSVPGPTLRVQQGSEISIDVVNEGDLETTVHWHGLRLDNRYDGTLATQTAIPVGGAFTYRLTFPDPGIYWYHPHIREDYGQEMGLYGNIIVVPSEPDYWPPAHREIALTLDDILLEEGRVAPFSRQHPTYTAMGRFGNVMLVNGESELSLETRSGEVVRFYLTNTANTRVFNVGLRGARMKLVGGDSGRSERETFVESAVIAPSERLVVDVLFEQPGDVTVEHRTPERTYPLAAISVGRKPARPSLAAQFGDLRTNPDMTAERARIADFLSAEPDKTLALVAEMSLGEPQLHAEARAEYVCPMHPEITRAQPDRCPQCGMKLIPSQLMPPSTPRESHHARTESDMVHDDHRPLEGEDPRVPAGIEWEDDMVDVNRMTNPTNMRWKLIDRQTGLEGTAIEWRFRVGQRVKIRLVNEMDSDHPMHHPFHIHGAGRFLILSRDAVAESNLVWRDTVLVRIGETVDILLDVTQPGVWMAHCHIAEHHESGMMLTFRVDQ